MRNGDAGCDAEASPVPLPFITVILSDQRSIPEERSRLVLFATGPATLVLRAVPLIWLDRMFGNVPLRICRRVDRKETIVVVAVDGVAAGDETS